VYPMFPVSLDCPFLIAPSVFSNVFICSSFILRCRFLPDQQVKTEHTRCPFCGPLKLPTLINLYNAITEIKQK
jgi:hypothetical protein